MIHIVQNVSFLNQNSQTAITSLRPIWKFSWRERVWRRFLVLSSLVGTTECHIIWLKVTSLTPRSNFTCCSIYKIDLCPRRCTKVTQMQFSYLRTLLFLPSHSVPLQMQSAPTFLALVHFTMTMSGRCPRPCRRRRRSLFPLFSPFSSKQARFLLLLSCTALAPPETRESETLLPCGVSIFSKHVGQAQWVWVECSAMFFWQLKN